MIDENTLKIKAESYLVCYANDCPLHATCLRWQVSQYVPKQLPSTTCVNPHYKNYATENCSLYRVDKPSRVAIGMTKLFREMPAYKEQVIKRALFAHFTRTEFYRLRRGEHPITPKMQVDIARICQQNGWHAPLNFDFYEEQLLW